MDRADVTPQKCLFLLGLTASFGREGGAGGEGEEKGKEEQSSQSGDTHSSPPPPLPVR